MLLVDVALWEFLGSTELRIPLGCKAKDLVFDPERARFCMFYYELHVT